MSIVNVIKSPLEHAKFDPRSPTAVYYEGLRVTGNSVAIDYFNLFPIV